MDWGLQGKVAAITGGSEGIGKATAIRLVQEGAKVSICARRKDILEAAAAEVREKGGGDCIAIVADISQAADVQRFIDETASHFGRLDIVVNNAGTSSAGPFEKTDDETWQADMDLKVYGAIRASRAALPHMKQQSGGRIINVTTVGGKQPAARSVPTSVTRAAGIALTKVLSKELAEHNILVNTVCVGIHKTAQIERAQIRSGLSADEFYARRGKDIPIGRVGEADEVATVITFLASGAASYVTGASINVDGGTSGVV